MLESEDECYGLEDDNILNNASQSDTDQEEENELLSDVESEDSWKSGALSHDIWTFNSLAGPHDILECLQPIDFYILFLIDELLNLVVNETNNYGRTKDPNF